MRIRCKVVCHQKTENRGSITKPDGTYGTGPVFGVRFGATGGNSEEDRAFHAATPSGQMEFGYVQKQTADQFEVGKSYYVEITPAE